MTVTRHDTAASAKSGTFSTTSRRSGSARRSGQTSSRSRRIGSETIIGFASRLAA
jgi:hypothetical protein